MGFLSLINIKDKLLEAKREIIYVDVGSTNSDNFRVCLYHMNNDDIHIMELEEIVNNLKNLKVIIATFNGSLGSNK